MLSCNASVPYVCEYLHVELHCTPDVLRVLFVVGGDFRFLDEPDLGADRAERAQERGAGAAGNLSGLQKKKGVPPLHGNRSPAACGAA